MNGICQFMPHLNLDYYPSLSLILCNIVRHSYTNDIRGRIFGALYVNDKQDNLLKLITKELNQCPDQLYAEYKENKLEYGKAFLIPIFKLYDLMKVLRILLINYIVRIYSIEGDSDINRRIYKMLTGKKEWEIGHEKLFEDILGKKFSIKMENINRNEKSSVNFLCKNCARMFKTMPLLQCFLTYFFDKSLRSSAKN